MWYLNKPRLYDIYNLVHGNGVIEGLLDSGRNIDVLLQSTDYPVQTRNLVHTTQKLLSAIITQLFECMLIVRDLIEITGFLKQSDQPTP